MPVSVKKVTLWRRDVDNRPGAMAQVLEPVARAGADLQVAMGYRIPGSESRAVIEVAPVSGKAVGAAEQAGLRPSDIPTLLVAGDNRPGLGSRLARAMADAGINMAFLVAQVVGGRYSAVFGFESEADADKAVGVIKKASPAAAKRVPGASRRAKGAGGRSRRKATAKGRKGSRRR